MENKDILEFNAPTKEILGGIQISPFEKANSVNSGSGKKKGKAIVKPDDYYEADFRMLSATVVGASSKKATEFSKEVLRNAVDKFANTPLYTDHDTYTVKNVIGYVKKVWFEEEKTMSNGVVVPAGINATVAIDTTDEVGLKMARNIETKSMHSVSVGIEFNWGASHKFDDFWGFYDALGTTNKKGELVRRVATEVLDVRELSLVFLGADPFAKLLDDDGELVNPDMPAITDLRELGFSKEEKLEDFNKIFGNKKILYSFDKNTLSLSKEIFSKNLDKNEDMELQEIIEKLGYDKNKVKTVEDLAAASIEAFSAKELEVEKLHKETQDKLTSLQADFEKYKGEKEAELTLLKDAATKYDTYLASLKATTIEAYKKAQLLKEQDADEAMIDLLSKSDEAHLKAFSSTFALKTAEALTATCKNCGKSDFEYKSAKHEEELDGNKKSVVVVDSFLAALQQK